MSASRRRNKQRCTCGAHVSINRLPATSAGNRTDRYLSLMVAHAVGLPGLLRNNSFAFLNRHQAVGRDVVDELLRAAEPSHLDSLRAGRLAQTEMQAKVALRAEAAAAADFLHLAAAFCLDDHARADGGPVRARPNQLDQQPTVLRGRLIVEQCRTVVDIV